MLFSNRRLSLFGLAACLALIAGRAETWGQDKKDKKTKNDYKVTIYDDEQFRGKYVVLRQDTPDLEALKFNNKSESIKWSLPAGKAVVCCDEKNYGRAVLVLVGDGEVKDLGKEQPNALHSITSVKIVACASGEWPKGVSKDIPKVGTEKEVEKKEKGK